MKDTKKIYYTSQVLEITDLKIDDLKDIEDEGLIEIRIENNVRYFLDEDIEKLKLIKLLKDEFEINLPGIDVILHLRDKLIELQENFFELIKTIKDEIKKEKKYIMEKEPDDIMVKSKGDIEPFKE